MSRSTVISIAIAVGTIALTGWWTAPMRAQAVNFNTCVSNGMELRDKAKDQAGHPRFPHWSNEQKRAGAVVWCNSGEF